MWDRYSCVGQALVGLLAGCAMVAFDEPGCIRAGLGVAGHDAEHAAEVGVAHG